MHKVSAPELKWITVQGRQCLVDSGGYKVSGVEGPAKCKTVVLAANSNSHKGSGASRIGASMDVMERMNMPMGYRLARGFAILRGGSV